MTAESRRCPFCGNNFFASIFHPHQRVCSDPRCQKCRRTEYHHRKYHDDAEYRLVCRESDQKWRSRNPDYQHGYRQEHPAYVEQNRHGQKRRDRRRRAHDLVKNNLALDLKSVSADVWLVGCEVEGLVKNNLAISEVMIFQTIAAPEVRPG
jgi:hypothetical protein